MRMDMQKFKKMLTVFGRMVSIICILFVGYRLYKLDIDWGLFARSPGKILIIMGLLFLQVIDNCLNVTSWKMYLDTFSAQKNSYSEIASIYLKSNIAKYLPGNVAHYVGRNVLGKKIGVKQSSILMATIFEVICLSVFNILFALVMSFQNTQNFISRLVAEQRMFVDSPILIMIVLIILMIGICVLVKYRKKIAHFLTKEVVLTVIKTIPIYIATIMVTALMLTLIFFAILNMPINYASVASANSLSWLAGYIVPGAPGGIGIREVVLVWLLEAECLPELVILAAVLLRICVIFGDSLSFLGAVFMDSLKRRKEVRNA